MELQVSQPWHQARSMNDSASLRTAGRRFPPVYSSPVAGQRGRHRKGRDQRGAACEDRGVRSGTAVDKRGHEERERQPRQLLVALQVAAHQLQHGEQRLPACRQRKAFDQMCVLLRQITTPCSAEGSRLTAQCHCWQALCSRCSRRHITEHS